MTSASETEHPATPPSDKEVRRAIGASAIGNATEWYDYGVYAVVVAYITANFFPGDGGTGTLLALATFAVSFLVRPLGGLVWGPLGDRIGRRRVLAMTIILMAGATVCIGLLPTFDAIGWWAPALLVLLRLVQGFSTGGEYGGAATFMAEYSPDRRRGFLGSFLEFGTILGFAFGTFVTLLLQLTLGEETMMDWGWRIPFLVAGPMGAIGLYLRSRLEDTPVFRELQDNDGIEAGAGTALKDLVAHYARPMLAMTGLVIALNVTNYTLLSYMPTYLEGQIGLSANGALTLILIGQVVMAALLPFAGRLSDRFGRKPLWWASLGGLFVAAVPMYLLIGTGFTGALIGFAVLGVLYVLQLSTISATFPAMFPTQVRFAGFAVTYNLATALFGGTAPAANEALINATGSLLVPAFYMMAACLVGMLALPFTRETAGQPITGTEIPGNPAPGEALLHRA
ncbi:Proline/betaine transporter [Arthrobacter saudimassiliensis]|uniref:Putative proline/betaine transporter n=1 Tax=Arthrobacter saudimassiliensis TaxID=1461584 RepID=A0A078MVA6_9MICC|nr:Proline/betaine transporter [Arthrobacter saudimassiliensis]